MTDDTTARRVERVHMTEATPIVSAQFEPQANLEDVIRSVLHSAVEAGKAIPQDLVISIKRDNTYVGKIDVWKSVEK